MARGVADVQDKKPEFVVGLGLACDLPGVLHHVLEAGQDDPLQNLDELVNLQGVEGVDDLLPAVHLQQALRPLCLVLD